jgi:hypothetical protein
MCQLYGVTSGSSPRSIYDRSSRDSHSVLRRDSRHGRIRARADLQALLVVPSSRSFTKAAAQLGVALCLESLVEADLAALNALRQKPAGTIRVTDAMLDSDSLYHRMFSHPQMVQDLVREFVPAAVAAGADLSGSIGTRRADHTTAGLESVGLATAGPISSPGHECLRRPGPGSA